MAKIWRTTLKTLSEQIAELRAEYGDDVPVSVHGEDCVDVRNDFGNKISLVGFHAHSKSEIKRLDAQGAIENLA